MIRFFLYISNFSYFSNFLLLYFCISVCLPGTPLWTGSKWPGSVGQGGEVVDVGDVLQREKGDVLQGARKWGIVKLEHMKSRSWTWILARTSGGSGGPWDRRSCRELRIT